MVDTYSDEQLEEALIKTNGQPSKAADLLSVSYQSVYKRIRRNPELLDFQRSTRQKTFQDISNFQVAAVLAGIIKTPEVYEDGSVRRDENGKVEYRDAIVGINARLEYASRLMTLFKSDEGIKDETEVNIKTAVDTSKLSDDTLNDLMAALKNDEK